MSDHWVDPSVKAALGDAPALPQTLDGTRIRIGLLDYTVHVERDPRSSDDRKLYGEIVYGDGTIRLDRDMRPAFQAIVLWHEIVHGLLEQAGQEQSEAICNALGFGLAQLIHDNPDLAALSRRLTTPKDAHATE